MNTILRNALAAVGFAIATQAAAQITFYENEGFEGRSFGTPTQVPNFSQYGFNNRASSVVVTRDRWEVCEEVQFRGRCIVLRPGRYPSLASMGLNNRVSSVRGVNASVRVEDHRYAPLSAQITFYEREGFTGQSFTSYEEISNLTQHGFNNLASSVVVLGERWEVCESGKFSGRCVVLRPGRYSSLASMGLNNRVSSMRIVDRNARVDNNRYAPLAAAHVTFYEHGGFQGRSFTANQQIGNFRQYGFNDRASSAVVLGDRWEVCEDVQFRGRCVVLRPGRYPSLAAMGLNDRASSVRPVNWNAHVDQNRYAPAPIPAYDNRRRNNEQLYQANVTSVRAVVGTPEQRCWVEREQVVQERSGPNVPGAIVGAIIGGVLGHQIGGGSGQDIATAGGAVAGAAVGANVGRNGQQVITQNVQRCATVPSQRQPEFWDVTYNFRGQEHRIQTTFVPGPTITVNAQGEPRA